MVAEGKRHALHGDMHMRRCKEACASCAESVCPHVGDFELAFGAWLLSLCALWVQNVRLITDRETGRSKGYAFVTMSSPEEVTAAIHGANGCVHA